MSNDDLDLLEQDFLDSLAAIRAARYRAEDRRARVVVEYPERAISKRSGGRFDRGRRDIIEQAIADYRPGPREFDEGGHQLKPFRPIHRKTATPSEAHKINADYPRRPKLDQQAEELDLRRVLTVAEIIAAVTENEVGATFDSATIQAHCWDERRQRWIGGLYGERQIADAMTRLALEGYACYSRPKRNAPIVWELLVPIDLDELMESRS